MGNGAGILFVKLFGYHFIFNVNNGTTGGGEGDRLIGGLVGALSGEATKEVPERCCSRVRRSRLDLAGPGIPCSGDGDVVDPSIQRLYLRIRWIAAPDVVSL